MPGQLHAIAALHETLTELADAEGQIAGIPGWMQELHAEHSQKKAEIEAVTETAEEAAKRRRGAEATLSDAQEKLAHYQGQISQVTTQREYGALLKEIDGVKNEISAQEQIAIEALGEHEEAEARRQELESSFQELDERYQQELAKWDEEKPAIATRAETLRSKVETLREKITKPQRRLYERLHERFGPQALSPVVSVEKPGGKSRIWSCSSCHYRVRPQLVVQIRSEGLVVQCDACKRILVDGTRSDDEEE